MKVKIGNRIYDSEAEPIMLIMSNEEKNHISSMEEKACKYCSFPNGSAITDIETFMEIPSTSKLTKDSPVCDFNCIAFYKFMNAPSECSRTGKPTSLNKHCTYSKEVYERMNRGEG